MADNNSAFLEIATHFLRPDVPDVMRKIYETWEDKFWDNCDGANFNFGVKTGWGEGFYNEYLLRKIEHDFSEEVDWIERIKNKINN